MKADVKEIESRSEAFRRYEELLRRLHQLEACTRGETEEADSIRDQMDAPFVRLSPDERAHFKSLSERLFKSHSEERRSPEISPSKYAAEHSGKDIIGSGVEIKGAIKFQRDLLIDGFVEGNIDSDGFLTIGENGFINGEVKTKSVTIYGKVVGNITVAGRCELKSRCVIQGDLKATRLVIEEGATFIGKSEVVSSGSQESKRQSAVPDDHVVSIIPEKRSGAVA